MANRDGGPAFPVSNVTADGHPASCEGMNPGMSLRAYAAIKLRVPESGIDWLDEMIERARRDEFAGQALVALPNIGCGADLEQDEYAIAAYQIADAMLAARTRGGER